MPGNVKARPQTPLDLPQLEQLEALSRAVLEAEAELESRKAGRAPRPVEDRKVRAIARMLQAQAGGHESFGLIGLADRQIGTVDYETVFAALCLATAEAGRDSAARGLPVTGL